MDTKHYDTSQQTRRLPQKRGRKNQRPVRPGCPGNDLDNSEASKILRRQPAPQKDSGNSGGVGRLDFGLPFLALPTIDSILIEFLK